MSRIFIQLLNSRCFFQGNPAFVKWSEKDFVTHTDGTIAISETRTGGCEMVCHFCKRNLCEYNTKVLQKEIERLRNRIRDLEDIIDECVGGIR